MRVRVAADWFKSMARVLPKDSNTFGLGFFIKHVYEDHPSSKSWLSVGLGQNKGYYMSRMGEITTALENFESSFTPFRLGRSGGLHRVGQYAKSVVSRVVPGWNPQSDNANDLFARWAVRFI